MPQLARHPVAAWLAGGGGLGIAAAGKPGCYALWAESRAIGVLAKAWCSVSIPELPTQPRWYAAGIGFLPWAGWRGGPRPAVVPAIVGALAVKGVGHVIQHMHAELGVPVAVATGRRGEVGGGFRAGRNRCRRRGLGRGARRSRLRCGLRIRRASRNARNRLRTLWTRVLDCTGGTQGHHPTQQGKSCDAIHRSSQLCGPRDPNY